MQDPQSAPYPKNSASEIKSRNILQYLLDEKHIRGDIRVLDKIPNVDGTLDFVGEDNRTIGKFEVQLKTIHVSDGGSPKYQCDLNFLGYCKGSTLPVFLICVDQQSEEAFWLYMNTQVVSEALGRASGDSVSISIPSENTIDKEGKRYLKEWRRIIEEMKDKLLDFGASKQEAQALKKKIDELEAVLRPAENLPESLLRIVHDFIDHYNFILDREFPVIKRELYSAYWKTGIAVLSYNEKFIHFLLYPVRYKDLQIQVKTMTREELKELNSDIEWSLLNFIVEMSTSLEHVKNRPLSYSYDLLRGDILRILDKTNFPVDDEFMAHEYLVAFIDWNLEYLNFERADKLFSLEELEFKISYQLPMFEGTRKGWADWVTEADVNIDSQRRNWSKENWIKHLEKANSDLQQGVVPKVKVTIASQIFGIELIYYYIKFLKGSGEKFARRQYGDSIAELRTSDPRTWNANELDNFKRTFEIHIGNFYRIYRKFLQQNFPSLKETLIKPSDGDNSILVVLRFSMHSFSYWAEMFFLRPVERADVRIFCFIKGDPLIPFEGRTAYKENTLCTLDEDQYLMVGYINRDIRYLYNPSPSYELIRLMLVEKIKRYLESKIE